MRLLSLSYYSISIFYNENDYEQVMLYSFDVDFSIFLLLYFKTVSSGGPNNKRQRDEYDMRARSKPKR